MVNSRPYSATGAMRGMNRCSYHSALGPLAERAREEPGQQGDAEEHEHALGDLPDGDVDPVTVQPKPSGQHVQVEPAEQREGEDLEQRVECHQHRRQFPIPAGQVVPDQHHGDAPGQTDDDQTGAVLRQIRQHQPGEREHHGRPDDPVEHQREGERPPVGDDVPDAGVLHLGQHRVHHQQQPDRDRQADGVHLHLVQRVVQPGEQATEAKTECHGNADPHRQQPVQRSEATGPIRLRFGDEVWLAHVEVCAATPPRSPASRLANRCAASHSRRRCLRRAGSGWSS